MADDNLETLDNASLRKKCLEYGLPNVPITDTSRKLLIRKLRAAISGETTEKKKNRRETVHVSKIPVADAVVPQVDEGVKREPTRLTRRTIANTEIGNIEAPVPVRAIPVVAAKEPSTTSRASSVPEVPQRKPTAITKRRKSSRSVNEQIQPSKVEAASKRKAVVLEEEDEDEDDDVIVVDTAESDTQEYIIPRARRSVSLSKTGVLTTSYSQERSVPRTLEVEVEFDDGFAKEIPLPKPTVIPQERPIQVEPSRISTSAFRTSTTTRTSINPEPQLYPSLSSLRYSNLDSDFSTLGSTIGSTSTRRVVQTNHGMPSYEPQHRRTTVYDEEEEALNPSDTPYLSEFARKLERLKSDSFSRGDETIKNVPIRHETHRGGVQKQIAGRRSTRQSENYSLQESFRRFLRAVDNKYQLKWKIPVVLIVFVVILIYIQFR